MTQADAQAIVILKRCYDQIADTPITSGFAGLMQRATLRNAIRHLAYPDRDIYPKTRRGTKGVPIVRR